MIRLAQPVMDIEEKNSVLEVLESGQLAEGSRVEKFEKEFAKYIGTKFAVATNSGTAALHVSCLSLGLGSNDEVVTSAFSHASSSNSILFCGASPVFSDIQFQTFNLDSEKIQGKLSENTKAILPVHLYGHPADMSPILEIAGKNNIPVLEDACQAHGAEYKKKKVGSIGKIGCFSFYPTKNMNTGEGGIATTDDKEIADKCKIFRNHGQEGKYVHTHLGYNYRMNEIQAAIGLVQLKKLDSNNKKRMENARILLEGLRNIKEIVLPAVLENNIHVFHQFVIRVKNRDVFRNIMEKSGVETAVHYPHPIYKNTLYQKLGYRDNLIETEKASMEVVSLPVHPNLTNKDLETIIDAVKTSVK